jgi:hypothetical protein
MSNELSAMSYELSAMSYELSASGGFICLYRMFMVIMSLIKNSISNKGAEKC